jgi:ABC-2 type transport system permease protein
MTGLIVRLQLTNWLRDRRLLGLLGVMALLLTLASGWATADDVARRHAQLEAATAARADWLGRGADHPHRRAHYGDFVFRPTGSLARLDRGVQAQLGKVLRIEAHRQGTPLHSDVSRAGTVGRFARPDAAFLLQIVVPLVLIFLGATGIAADRDAGRLKLSLIQGAPARVLAAAQFVALWGLGLGLIALVVAASLGTSGMLDGLSGVSWERLAGFVGVHALFLAVVSAAVVSTALWSRSARSALLALLALWVVATALLPRATGSTAHAMYPLPSQDAFQAAMQEAREAGPDGHNPEDEAIEQRKQELLKEHGVASTDELPIDFGGIAMQMDEDFGNEVWDSQYGALRAQLEQQSAVMTGVSLFNPFQAVDHVSMALTGTDLAHDIDFQSQSEAYRRDLVRALNHEHAYGGPEKRDRSWEASPAFFASLDSFQYTPPSFRAAVQHRAAELVSLAVWALLWLWAIRLGADRLERGGLPC